MQPCEETGSLVRLTVRVGRGGGHRFLFSTLMSEAEMAFVRVAQGSWQAVSRTPPGSQSRWRPPWKASQAPLLVASALLLSSALPADAGPKEETSSRQDPRSLGQGGWSRYQQANEAAPF